MKVIINGVEAVGGANGFSPTVEVTEIDGGHRITITDVNGPKSFDVMDGTGGGTPSEPVEPPETQDAVFGVCWNYSNQSTALSRLTPENDPNGHTTMAVSEEPVAGVGSTMGSSPFDNYLPWSGMEEYNIINGEATYKRGDDGFSRSAYDTMVYIPEFWYLVIDDAANRKRYFYVSGTEKAGFEKHPGSGRYVGRYNTGDGYVSKTGLEPLVSITRAQARTGSTGKGAGWYLYDFASWQAWVLLYLVEYADWDSQTTVGRGYVDDNSAAINSGGTDAMSYHTGRASGTDGKTAVQYRHIENPWGNVYDWVDGANFTDRVAWICTDPTKFADDTRTGYTNSGVTLPPVNNYISGLGFSQSLSWALIPNASAGSETTYIPDRVYSNTGWRVFAVGGAWAYGFVAGALLFTASHVSSYADAGFGARLLKIP